MELIKGTSAKETVWRGAFTLTPHGYVIEVTDWTMKAEKEALLAEELRLRKLRRIGDFTTAMLYQADLTLNQAQKLIADAKARALELFPDKGETFDLIYGSRLRRIVTERFRLQ